MTVYVPYAADEPIEFRIAFSDGWTNEWEMVRMWEEGTPGVLVESITSKVLPEIGEAIITAHFGIIDGKPVFVNLGESPVWLSSSYYDLPDLLKKIIRIQSRRRYADQSVTTWRTVFLGVARFQDDQQQPAASNEGFGIRRWRCVDLLYGYSGQWTLNEHDWAPNDDPPHTACQGHPGYNSEVNGVVLGNKHGAASTSIANISVDVFAQHGSQYALRWTDAEVLRHLLTCRRRPRTPSPGSPVDPYFTLLDLRGIIEGSGGLQIQGDYSAQDASIGLQAENVWDVDPLVDTVWDMLTQILRRQRGRGLAFLAWEPDADSADSFNMSTINSIYLILSPQHKDTITTTSEVPTIIPGAVDRQTTIDVDLINDHRFVDGSFDVGVREQYRVDYLETVGERIEVALSLSYTDDTLEPGWSTALASEYDGLDSDKRTGPKFRNVYNLHRLAQSAGLIFRAGDTLETVLERWSYTADDNGIIDSGDQTKSSLAVCEIMADLPLLAGWDYTVDPPQEPETEAQETPARRPPSVWAQSEGSAGHFTDQSSSILLTIDAASILAQHGGDESEFASIRKFGDPAESERDYRDLVFNLGVRLGSRVRFASGDPSSSRRRTIFAPNKHLWILHPGTYTGLDGDDLDSEGAPAGQNIPEKLILVRDDRDALELQHALAWQWYGQDHVACSWALKTCGLHPVWRDCPGTPRLLGTRDRRFPRLGQFVTTMRQNGQTSDINAPITSITYDHTTGVTTWQTSWLALD